MSAQIKFFEHESFENYIARIESVNKEDVQQCLETEHRIAILTEMVSILIADSPNSIKLQPKMLQLQNNISKRKKRNNTGRVRLIIGNKNYSSWSLRAWLPLCVSVGITGFDEVVISLEGSGSSGKHKKYSPTGKVPCLVDRELVLWDSLSICEYLAESYPLWPENRSARAFARSVVAEMHSGYSCLRSGMPMNIRKKLPGKGMIDGVQKDISRIIEVWETCRKRYGQEGPFLFGKFSIADAFFAPVVMRFLTYQPLLTRVVDAYCNTISEMPEMKHWIEAAKKETLVIPSEER